MKMKMARLLTLTLAILMLMSSSVFASTQAEEGPSTSPQAAEPSHIEGLIFDPAKSNSVQLQKKLDNIPATFEMRAKFAVNPNHRQILFGNFRSGASTSFGIELTVNNQLRYFELINGNVIDKSTVGKSVTTGEWTHLAVIRDAANKRITFIQDGAVIDTFENLDLPEQVQLVNLHGIGADTRDQHHIRAEVSEVRLWNDVRTLDEIKDNASVGIKGDEEGLKHAWTLDSSVENGLNVVHDKAGKNNGTAIGFQKEVEIETPYVSEFTGSGIDFSDGQLEIAAKERLSAAPRTVEAWVNVPANTPSEKRVGVILGNYFDHYYRDIARFNFEVTTNGKPRIYWKSHADYELSYTANVNVNVGDWVHVAMALDDTDNTATTYINGKKINEAYMTSPIPTSIPVSELKIGSDYRGYAEDGKPLMTFNGQIADVRVWSTVRTDEEIKANYNVSLQGNETGLMGNWKLNNGSHDVYPDTSVNQNDGLVYDDETENWLEPEFAQGDYTIAVLPDTQYFVEHHPAAFKNYMTWMKDHADDMNIKLAIGVGDIVNNPGSTAEWNTASEGMSILDGTLPYVFVPGNHDYNNQTGRITTNFNKYFPYSKYSQASTFGGAYVEGKMDNTYHYFDINGMKYMIIALEYGPDDSVLAWANELAAENPDKRIIVTTHAYMYHTGEQISLEHMDDPGSYMPGGNNGDDMWNEFVSKHENIVLVLSGHIGYPDLIVREDIGVNGNAVKQVLTDAQFMAYDLGMVMLMTFKEGSDDVEVNWYSVTKDKLFRAKNQFSMELNLTGDENSNPNPDQMLLAAADQTVSKGSTFTVPVTVDRASKLVGIEGLINFNKDLLALEKFEFAAFKETSAHNTAVPGKVSFAGVSNTAVGTDENTVIANIVFRAKADIVNNEKATISFANVQAVTENAAGDPEHTPIGTKDASITITSFTLGDVNGDHKLDILDATEILKLIVAAPNEENEAKLAAADVNGDNVVDTADVLSLLQMIADRIAAPVNP